MKFAFFLVSLMCAILLSILSFIVATGTIPFQEPEVEVTAQDAFTESVDPMVSTNVAAVKNLVKALELERENLKRKALALEDRQEEDELEIKLARLEDLKEQIEAGMEELEKEMEVIEADERKNLKSIGEVYSKMDPENAAGILEKMESERAAMILYLMTERNAAAILDAVAARGDDAREMAKEWAEIIRKLKHDTNN